MDTQKANDIFVCTCNSCVALSEKFKGTNIIINGSVLTESHTSTVRSALSSLYGYLLEIADSPPDEYVEKQLKNIQDIRNLIYSDDTA